MVSQKKNIDVDVLILGTSPISLLKAYLCSKKGKSVAVIEKKSVLGGSWRVCSHKEFRDIDMGPHHFAYDRKVFKFLEKEFNLNLRRLYSTPSVFSMEGRKFLNPKVFYFKRNIQNEIKRLKISRPLKELLNIFLNLPLKLLNLFSPPIHYLKGGSLEILNKILGRVQEQCVIISDCHIEKICVPSSRESKISVDTNNANISCEKIYIPSSAQVDLNRCCLKDGKKVDVEEEKTTYRKHFQTVFLHIKNVTDMVDYCFFVNEKSEREQCTFGDGTPMFYNDLSKVCSNNKILYNQGERLISLSFSQMEGDSGVEFKEISYEKILGYLIESDFVNKNASLINGFSQFYDKTCRNVEKINGINRYFNSKIEFMYTSDMTAAIRELLVKA